MGVKYNIAKKHNPINDSTHRVIRLHCILFRGNAEGKLIESTEAK
jgi:hypothetical protein